MANEIVNVETPNVTVVIPDDETETPAWQPIISEVVASSRELLSEMRGQAAAQAETNQMLRSLAETLISTNQRLTETIVVQSTLPPSQEVVVVETPPSDIPNPDALVTDPSEVVVEQPPAASVARVGRRYL